MNKRTLREIRKIHESVPLDLRDRLFEEVYLAPDLRLEARKQAQELFEEANGLPDGPERKAALKTAQRLQNIIDAGYYDQKEMRVNPEVAKQIDEWIGRELDKAIDAGRIPHPKHDKEHQNFIRKLKQHEHHKRRDDAISRAGGLQVSGSEAQPDDQAGGSAPD